MIKRLFLLAALAGVLSVSAQNGTLGVRLVDRVTREPVVGAVAELRSPADRPPLCCLLYRITVIRAMHKKSCDLCATFRQFPVKKKWRPTAGFGIMNMSGIFAFLRNAIKPRLGLRG